MNNSNSKRHKKILKPVRFTIAVSLCILILVFSFGALLGLFDSNASKPQTYVYVKVQSGDTLWGLAKSYGPQDQDVRKVVYDICQINNITASTLQAGQYISIPTI